MKISLDISIFANNCFRIRKTIWDRLRLFSGGSLSVALSRLIAHESEMSDVLPLITEAHLSAIDRRLLTIYAVVENCLRRKKYSSSIILDHR